MSSPQSEIDFGSGGTLQRRPHGAVTDALDEGVLRRLAGRDIVPFGQLFLAPAAPLRLRHTLSGRLLISARSSTQSLLRKPIGEFPVSTAIRTGAFGVLRYAGSGHDITVRRIRRGGSRFRHGRDNMLRTEKILAGLSRDMRFVEIGPSFNPVVPKRDGWKVWTVDHTTRDGLIEKYKGQPGVDVSRIEEVDFVLIDQPLDSIFPIELHGTIDACIASHVIEHTPNIVGFFRSLAKVLAPEGIISLAVPDKRFCFDYFRPHSTTGEILEAHTGSTMRHRPAALFDHLAYACSIDGTIAWEQSRVGSLQLVHSLGDAWKAYSCQPFTTYVDCHGWQFTPASFELIALELAALELIEFRITRTFPSEGFEFFVQLKKGRGEIGLASELNARRITLLKRMMEELRQPMNCISRNSI